MSDHYYLDTLQRSRRESCIEPSSNNLLENSDADFSVADVFRVSPSITTADRNIPELLELAMHGEGSPRKSTYVVEHVFTSMCELDRR